MSANPVCSIVTPVGMLGYGFNEDDVRASIERLINVPVPTPVGLVLDSGSTDGGPSKLARGHLACPRSAYVRDLTKLLRLVRLFKIPLLISSAGGSGTNAQVDEIYEIIGEIAAKEHYKLNVLRIYSDIPKHLVTRRLQSGLVTGCGSTVPPLSQADVSSCPVIASQMGPEPFLAAMASAPDYDVIVGGRAYDPAPYVAFATAAFRSQRPDDARDPARDPLLAGGIMHMGKVVECGGVCATPKGFGAVATLRADGGFDIAPTDPAARCTPLSVAAHALYEKSRPDVLHGPGGWIDLTGSRYEQLLDGRTTRVGGTTWHASMDNGLPYQVKLEAARVKGFRSMYMGSIKDPILISQIDNLLPRIRAYIRMLNPGRDDEWEIDWHIYGRGTAELFVVGEGLATTQDLATGIINSARTGTIHGSYPGQKATAGNFSHGIGGTGEVALGECSEFCIYHLMALQPGEETATRRAETPGEHHDGQPLFTFTCTSIDHSAGSVEPTISVPVPSSSRPQEAEKRRRGEAEKQPPPVPEKRPSECAILGELASVLRSKNSGPYEITFDVMFGSAPVYDAVKRSGLLSAGRVGQLYGLSAGAALEGAGGPAHMAPGVIWAGFFDQARAFKATIPRLRDGRPVAAGGFMESDIHGAQMHVPLFSLELSQGLKKELAEVEASDIV